MIQTANTSAAAFLAPNATVVGRVTLLEGCSIYFGAVLRAEAVKETKIREAQGEAEAVLTVQRAVADAIKLMNEANPSELQGLAGLAAGAKAVFADEEKA